MRKVPIKLLPTSEVSIVCFPFGHAQAAGLPIWKNGAIASDPDVDYANSPQILVDCTGRPGMSGSPVYARRIGSLLDENGQLMAIVGGNGAKDRFIGVYAGDIDGMSEVGRIWKASVVMDMYDSLP